MARHLHMPSAAHHSHYNLSCYVWTAIPATLAHGCWNQAIAIKTKLGIENICGMICHSIEHMLQHHPHENMPGH
jgi:hypothetical protein